MVERLELVFLIIIDNGLIVVSMRNNYIYNQPISLFIDSLTFVVVFSDIYLIYEKIRFQKRYHVHAAKVVKITIELSIIEDIYN